MFARGRHLSIYQYNIGGIFDESILFCVVYIPPENTTYSKIDMFDTLEELYIQYKDDKSHFCLLGDINARTRNLSDHIIVDDQLLNDLNIDEIVGNVVKPISTVLHRDTDVWQSQLPARPSKMTGAAIENDRRGIENDRRNCMYVCMYAAIETYRRGHRNLPAWPSKPTGAAIETYRRGHRNDRRGHRK